MINLYSFRCFYACFGLSGRVSRISPFRLDVRILLGRFRTLSQSLHIRQSQGQAVYQRMGIRTGIKNIKYNFIEIGQIGSYKQFKYVKMFAQSKTLCKMHENLYIRQLTIWNQWDTKIYSMSRLSVKTFYHWIIVVLLKYWFTICFKV